MRHEAWEVAGCGHLGWLFIGGRCTVCGAVEVTS